MILTINRSEKKLKNAKNHKIKYCSIMTKSMRNLIKYLKGV